MLLRVLAGAIVVTAALAACQRGADTGATSSPNAPGSPATGNPTTGSAPQAGESSSGRGPSGVAGSVAHPGASGGDAVPGASGKGMADASGQATTQPGTGLQGGLGASTGQTALGAGPAASKPAGADQANQQERASAGSTNRTSNGSVGNRR